MGRSKGEAINTFILTIVNIIDIIIIMTKRITANLPSELLDEASSITGKGITETLIEGLGLIRRSRAFSKAAALRGKIHLDINLDIERERAPETAGRRS